MPYFVPSSWSIVVVENVVFIIIFLRNDELLCGMTITVSSYLFDCYVDLLFNFDRNEKKILSLRQQSSLSCFFGRRVASTSVALVLLRVMLAVDVVRLEITRRIRICHQILRSCTGRYRKLRLKSALPEGICLQEGLG
jgi:hypothetical protein